MSASRHITLPAHGAFEFILGLAVGLSAFALGLGAGATVAMLAVAAVILTVAVTGGIADERGIPGLPPTTHRGFDLTFVVALAAGAVLMAVVASPAAGLVLLAAAAALLVLTLTTRYAARA